MITAWVHLKHGIDPPALVKSLNLFRVFSNMLQNLISGLAFLVSQRKVYAIRSTFRFMRKNILLHLEKP